MIRHIYPQQLLCNFKFTQNCNGTDAEYYQDELQPEGDPCWLSLVITHSRLIYVVCLLQIGRYKNKELLWNKKLLWIKKNKVFVLFFFSCVSSVVGAWSSSGSRSCDTAEPMSHCSSPGPALQRSHTHTAIIKTFSHTLREKQICLFLNEDSYS